jgi:hypothetical protein
MHVIPCLLLSWAGWDLHERKHMRKRCVFDAQAGLKTAAALLSPPGAFDAAGRHDLAVLAAVLGQDRENAGLCGDWAPHV